MKVPNILPILHNTIDVFEALCKPYCKEINLPQTAFDILMFLGDNPECIARDIIKYRGIRPNLVTHYVDLLVKKGYLERKPIEGNRRSIRLICTEKARPIIESGHQIQNQFFEILFNGISEDKRTVFSEVAEHCSYNLVKAKDAIRKA